MPLGVYHIKASMKLHLKTLKEVYEKSLLRKTWISTLRNRLLVINLGQEHFLWILYERNVSKSKHDLHASHT